LNFRPHVNVVFDIISVPCTITDLQAPETLYYIHRLAKWNNLKNVLSTPQNAIKKQLKHKTQVRNGHLMTDITSSMKDYTCH
jgi:hypothetical protein